MKVQIIFFVMIYSMISISFIGAHKIGLCVVATGRYIEFIPPLIASAKKYFCTNHEVTYFVFTDGQLQPSDDVTVLPWKKLGWPADTLLRFFAYYQYYEHLKKMDYIFACDADVLFVDNVGDEILSDLVASQSPGWIGRRGTYEYRPQSTAYVGSQEGEYYFAGGFYGGKSEHVYSLLQEVLLHIATDYNNNIIAIWHDESHLNRYFIDHKPSLILPREYLARPFDFPQRLVVLDKDHMAFR